MNIKNHKNFPTPCFLKMLGTSKKRRFLCFVAFYSLLLSTLTLCQASTEDGLAETRVELFFVTTCANWFDISPQDKSKKYNRCSGLSVKIMRLFRSLIGVLFVSNALAADFTDIHPDCMDPSGAPRNVTAATQPVFRGARVAIIARDLTGSPYLLVQCEQGLDEKRKMRRKWTTQGGAVDEKDYDPDEEEFFKNAAVREAFEETRGIVRLERDRLELINRIEMPNPILKYRGEILKRRTYVCVLEPGSCEYISQQIRAGLISGVREGKGTVIVEHKLVALEMIVGGAEGFRFRGYHHRPTWPFGHHGAETFNALRRLHMLWEREKQDIIEEPVAERMALFLEEVALWGSL